MMKMVKKKRKKKKRKKKLSQAQNQSGVEQKRYSRLSV